MSTRGLVGFYKGGITKVSYNHSDSYPEYLGKKMLEFVKNNSVEVMNDIFDRVIMVKEDKKPTPKQIEKCKKFANLGVGNQKITDWYCLLREAQGDLDAFKEIRYMIDGKDFIEDSLFCEWAYILNLDTNTSEVYKGFQKEPQEDRPNRYSYTEKQLHEVVTEAMKHRTDVYHPCALVAEYSFDRILNEDAFDALDEETFLREMKEIEDLSDAKDDIQSNFDIKIKNIDLCNEKYKGEFDVYVADKVLYARLSQDDMMDYIVRHTENGDKFVNVQITPRVTGAIMPERMKEAADMMLKRILGKVPKSATYKKYYASVWLKLGKAGKAELK